MESVLRALSVSYKQWLLKSVHRGRSQRHSRPYREPCDQWPGGRSRAVSGVRRVWSAVDCISIYTMMKVLNWIKFEPRNQPADQNDVQFSILWLPPPLYPLSFDVSTQLNATPSTNRETFYRAATLLSKIPSRACHFTAESTHASPSLLAYAGYFEYYGKILAPMLARP